MASEPDQAHPSAYGASATALLLMDYHDIFVRSVIQDATAREGVIASAKALLAAARENNVPVFHCLLDTSRDPPPTNKLLASWTSGSKPAVTANPQLMDEHAELAPLAGGEGHSDVEFTVKRAVGHVSALKSTGIMTLLREKLGVKSLVVCGLTSSGCVLGTVANAADEDFVVTVAEDACYDRDPAVHDMVMGSLLSKRAWVVKSEEAVGYLR